MSKGPFASADTLKDYLDVSVHTVRQWVRDGKIPRTAYMKIGTTYRFHVPAVQDALMHYEERRSLTTAEREAITAKLIEDIDSMPTDTPKRLKKDTVADVETQLEHEYKGTSPLDDIEVDQSIESLLDENL